MTTKQSNDSDCASQTETSKLQSTAQTEPTNQEIQTQTKLTIEQQKIYEYCMSRVDPIIVGQEEIHPSVEQPNMTSTHAWELQQKTQQEASHKMIMEEIMATVNQEANTEIEEDTPLYRKKLTESFRAQRHCRLNPNRSKFSPAAKFRQKRDCEALSPYFEQNRYNIRNQLHVQDDCT